MDCVPGFWKSLSEFNQQIHPNINQTEAPHLCRAAALQVDEVGVAEALHRQGVVHAGGVDENGLAVDWGWGCWKVWELGLGFKGAWMNAAWRVSFT